MRYKATSARSRRPTSPLPGPTHLHPQQHRLSRVRQHPNPCTHQERDPPPRDRSRLLHNPHPLPPPLDTHRHLRPEHQTPGPAHARVLHRRTRSAPNSTLRPHHQSINDNLPARRCPIAIPPRQPKRAGRSRSASR